MTENYVEMKDEENKGEENPKNEKMEDANTKGGTASNANPAEDPKPDVKKEIVATSEESDTTTLQRAHKDTDKQLTEEKHADQKRRFKIQIGNIEFEYIEDKPPEIYPFFKVSLQHQTTLQGYIYTNQEGVLRKNQSIMFNKPEFSQDSLYVSYSQLQEMHIELELQNQVSPRNELLGSAQVKVNELLEKDMYVYEKKVQTQEYFKQKRFIKIQGTILSVRIAIQEVWDQKLQLTEFKMDLSPIRHIWRRFEKVELDKWNAENVVLYIKDKGFKNKIVLMQCFKRNLDGKTLKEYFESINYAKKPLYSHNELLLFIRKTFLRQEQGDEATRILKSKYQQLSFVTTFEEFKQMYRHDKNMVLDELQPLVPDMLNIKKQDTTEKRFIRRKLEEHAEIYSEFINRLMVENLIYSFEQIDLRKLNVESKLLDNIQFQFKCEMKTVMFGKENLQTLITETSDLVFSKQPIFLLGSQDHFFYRGTKGDLANGLLKFTLYKVQGAFSTQEIASIQIPIKGILESKKIKFAMPTWKILDQELQDDIQKQMKQIQDLKSAKQGIDEVEQKKLKHFLGRQSQVKVEGKLIMGNQPRFEQAVMDQSINPTPDIKQFVLEVRSAEISTEDSRSDVNSQISVEFAGIFQKTRMMIHSSNPVFNERLNFVCPFSNLTREGEDQVQVVHLIKELEAMNDVKINIWGVEGGGLTENQATAKYYIKDFMEKSNPNAVVEFQRRQRVGNPIPETVQSRLHSTTLNMENIFMSNKVSSLRIDVCFITPISDQAEQKMIGEQDASKLTFLSADEIERIKMKLSTLNRQQEEAPLMKIRSENIRIKNQELDHFQFPQYLSITFPDMINEVQHAIKMDQYRLQSKTDYPLQTFNEQIKLPYFINLVKGNPPYENGDDQFKKEIIGRWKNQLYIFNWVRVLQFSKRQADSVWAQPEFIFKVSKASPADKSILLANFFMGLGKVEEEVEPDQRDKQLSMIDRTFVCIGRDHKDQYFKSWVMTIDEHMESITFWEPFNGNYQIMPERPLHRRISDKQETTKQLNQTKHLYLKDSLNIEFLDEETQVITTNSNTITSLIGKLLKTGIANKAKAQEDAKKVAEDELDLILENQILEEENPDIFSKMHVGNVGVNLQEQAKVDINVISDQLQKSDDSQAHMKSNSVPDDFPGGKCPYSSIDLVFNKRNIWFNRQHFNPAVITYDLWDPFRWCEVFDANQLNINEYYPPISLFEPLSQDKVLEIEKAVQYQVKNYIRLKREENTQRTMWATIDEDFRVTLETYLKKREMLSRGDLTMDDFNYWMVDQFNKKIKSKIPEESNFDFKEFWTNSSNPQDIERYFSAGDMEKFIANKNNMTYWIVTVKVSPQKCKTLSLRIMVSFYYTIISNEYGDNFEMEQNKRRVETIFEMNNQIKDGQVKFDDEDLDQNEN